MKVGKLELFCLVVGALGCADGGVPRPETRAIAARPTIVCPAESLLIESGPDRTCVRRDASERGEEIRHGPERLYYRDSLETVFAEGSWVEGHRDGRWTWYFRKAPGRVFAELDFEHGVPRDFCPAGTEYREWGERPGLSTAHLRREYPTDSPHLAYLLDVRRMRLAIGCVMPSDERFEIRHGPQIDIFRGGSGHFRGHFGQGPAGQSRSHYADGFYHGIQRSWSWNGALRHESEYRRGERHGIERSFEIDGRLRSRSEWRRGRRVQTTRLEQGRLVGHEEYRFRSEDDYTTETFAVDAPWRQLDIRPCQGGTKSLLSIDGIPVEGLRYDADGGLREIHAYADGVRIQATELLALRDEHVVGSVGADGLVEEVSFHSRYTGSQRRIRFDRGRPLDGQQLAGGEVQSGEPTHRPAVNSSCEAEVQ